MNELEVVINNEIWQVKLERDNFALQPYWGADTLRKEIYVYNTQDKNYIALTKEIAKRQYTQQ